MKTFYNAQINNQEKKYNLQFETDNFKWFKEVETICRQIIDKNTLLNTYPVKSKGNDDTDILSLEEQLDNDPKLKLISASEVAKVYYYKDCGMYYVLFFSTGEVCLFDEYCYKVNEGEADIRE